jgi:hypothetical protein
VVAVYIHPERTTIALADMSGNISSLSHVALPANPKRVIASIVAAIRKVIADHPGFSFQGIGINLPGRFNRQLEKAVFAPNVGWPIAHIKSQVEQSVGLLVVVERCQCLRAMKCRSVRSMHNGTLWGSTRLRALARGSSRTTGCCEGAVKLRGISVMCKLIRMGGNVAAEVADIGRPLASSSSAIRYYQEIPLRPAPLVR